MLKREITYEDFNDEKVTDVFYFNISKPELVEMELEFEGGLTSLIKKLIETKNFRELILMFKKIVLMAYGEKSDDGKQFVKNDTLRERFSQMAAYNVLFMELATDSNAAAEFLKGALPKDLVVDLDKTLAETPLTAVPTPTT